MLEDESRGTVDAFKNHMGKSEDPVNAERHFSWESQALALSVI